ncbi:hypothetical protein L7F22_051796 [Adiantum nelumboides]|nr:hypothetical protein [Adiantum nelumboides]
MLSMDTKEAAHTSPTGVAITIAFVFAYVAFFSVGLGPISYVLTFEIFPLVLYDSGRVRVRESCHERHCGAGVPERGQGHYPCGHLRALCGVDSAVRGVRVADCAGDQG